jgi:hypothetical protein
MEKEREFSHVKKIQIIYIDTESSRRENRSQVPVAQACNPSYSGGRDQEDRGSKPAWPYLEKPLHKKGLVEWLKVKALSSSPSIAKNKTNKQKKEVEQDSSFLLLQ